MWQLTYSVAKFPHAWRWAIVRWVSTNHRNYVNPRGYVVVLEEDPLIRPLLERWLGEAGYRVQASAEAGEARPALVIADVPDPRSAEALIASLREYAAPILVISARFRRGLAGSAEAARRLGVKKVLPKPFNREELLAAVRESVEDVA
jgi:DNA-binding response OmpR family regulator